jgi:uncharacterized protein YycO
MILRFVTSGGIVSAAIRAGEYGFWCSHVEAVMPDETLLGAHIDGGVQARPAGYDRGTATRELFAHLPATTPQDAAFHTFLRAQIGKPYDITAIEALVAERDWTAPDSWFCSELQAAALRACGWFASDLATGFAKITPRDLLLMLSGRIPIEGGPP